MSIGKIKNPEKERRIKKFTGQSGLADATTLILKIKKPVIGRLKKIDDEKLRRINKIVFEDERSVEAKLRQVEERGGKP